MDMHENTSSRLQFIDPIIEKQSKRSWKHLTGIDFKIPAYVRGNEEVDSVIFLVRIINIILGNYVWGIFRRCD